MTDQTNMDTYEASASDCIATQPSLLSSRKPHHRKFHSRNSAYYKRRQASYQHRRTKRIRDSDYPELSSSDEFDFPPPLTQSGFPNPNFLPYMPRPSDIVPAIEDGSASDAGFDRNARHIHKRRVDAMRILLASIDSRGNIIPVPHWKRNKSGLNKYTTYMNPPKEDSHLPDKRVPPLLLSRSYRGSLLAVHRVGRSAKDKPKKNPVSSEPSAFECEYLGSSSRSDFEVTQVPTAVKDEPQEIVQHDNAHSPVDASEKDSVKESTAFSKSAFLEELDKVAAASSDGLSDAEMERIREIGVEKRNAHSDSEEEVKLPAKPKDQAESETPVPDCEVQEISKPEKKSEIELFREMLANNPELLFEQQKPLDKEACVIKATEAQEEVVEEEEEEEDDSNLSEFQKDKRKAMLFSHNSTKPPPSKAQDMAAKYLNPSKRRKHAGNFADGGGTANTGTPKSTMNLKFTMKLMNKMGFTGRLGKKEDGRRDPLFVTRHSFRSGIGSCPTQGPPRKGGQSLLPTKFKGKSVENGRPAGSSDIPDAAGDDEVHANGVVPSKRNHSSVEGGDVYTRRRKRRASAPDKEAHLNRSSPGANGSTIGPVGKAPTRQLDDTDIYETEDEDSGIDNGRRAILIDIDALIKDSSKRRLCAIEKMLRDAKLVLNMKSLLEREPRDLCEAELLRKVLGHANVKPHDMDDYKDKLDEAFESLPAPELETELLDMLRQYSKDVHFGIFHRGSRRRLQYDLRATGLTNSFLQEVCAIVKHEEKWPYMDTWQDLTCRVGVAPRQCLYVVSEARIVKCKHDWRPSTGVTAGTGLGGQTAVWEKVEDGVKLHVRGPMQKEQIMKINNSSAYKDRKKVFDGILENRMPVLKRRRVLAEYESDQLWYSAVVQYEGARDGKCWIRFNKFENTEWVCTEDLVPLCRRDFRKMKKMDFPGILEPDASFLE